ncbi:hypothetical protein [Aquimarina brevivitae]|uniref:Endosialidase-like protein n=1 Tax=Aquimarina brevivitae TaxID=323412 RepID=A0A4Q7PID1_9FLAO|nr:hypothetical protein [Aquimarina brevivitae]RZT00337.1 hypothetical protein EV197_1573 [Aquimarina brevivitae]
MKNIIAIATFILLTRISFAQTETSTNEKIDLQSPTGVSLFQSTSSNGIWATGMITADRWGVFEDATSANERLTILPGGNVGIGTTNPPQRLTVQFTGESGIAAKAISNGSLGAANIVVDPATGFPGRFLFRENGQNKAWIDYLGGKINIRDSSNTPFFTVLTNNGNVGIGTTNPSEKLDVIGRIRASQSIDVTGITNPTSGVTMNLAYSASDFGLVRARDWNNNTWKPIHYQASYHNFATGNVGIGTSNPGRKLQIVDGAFNRMKTSIGTLQLNQGSREPALFVSRWLGSGSLYQSAILHTENSMGSYGLAFSMTGTHDDNNFSNYSTKMYLTQNGNLGIGTTTPDAKLAVNGTIHSKEVKVDLIGWPDYVFESDYHLPTLQEVEQHINEKGHLQNIPSAAEVEKEGVKLGEMNAKLLQKIEELTLYMIEQDKKMNQLKELVLDQQKEIKELKK